MNREVASKIISKTLEAVFNAKSTGDENIKDAAKLMSFLVKKHDDFKTAIHKEKPFNENDVENNTRFLTLGAKVVAELCLLVDNYAHENRWHSFVFEIVARHERYNVSSKQFELFLKLVMDYVADNTVIEEDTKKAWLQFHADFCKQSKMSMALLGLKDRCVD